VAEAFAFEDISATGTIVAGLTNTDDAAASVPIGFAFPFYGSLQTAVFVSSNGLLTFGSGNTGFSNTDLTSSPTQEAIAVFWDDLHTGGGVAGSGVYYQVSGSGADQHVTLQWNNVRFFSGTAGDTITFQAQLYADGRIRLNYPDLVSGSAAGNNGASASVGLKAAGTQGQNRLLLAFNNGPNAFVGTGQSTRLSPPVPTRDHYSFTLEAGDVATLALEAGGDATLELLGPTGTVLATGGTGPTNVDVVVRNAVAGTTGLYYARIGSAFASPYTLVVVRNAAFDLEGNDTFDAAQAIVGNRGALGAAVRGGAYSGEPSPAPFEDISATGTIIAGLTGQDDASVSIPIGFVFPFYGGPETTAFVSSNGLITFGAGNSGFSNADLTTAPSQAAIAPFWDDLHTGGGAAGSGVYYQVLGSGADQRLVIQWNQVRFFSGTAGDTITFQAVLKQDGSVRFNYLDLVSGSAAGNNGASATVGVKGAGTQGPNRLLLAFNNGPNAFVGTGLSTLISQALADDWYSVTLSGIQHRVRAETSTPADGPGEFVNNLDPHIELYDSTGATLIVSGTPLGDGRNEVIDATGLAAPGTYLIRVSGDSGTSGEYFLAAAVPPAPFTGFFPPISNTGLNGQTAGQSVPIRFSLGADEGLNILVPGSPASRRINCTSFAGIGPWQPTTSVAGLQYDPVANQYIYVWKTLKAWARTCRELDVTTVDGVHHTARFRFQ
jgi:hypothetical protein